MGIVIAFTCLWLQLHIAAIMHVTVNVHLVGQGSENEGRYLCSCILSLVQLYSN